MANPVEPLRYGQLGALGRVHVKSDGVHVTDEAGIGRVQLGRLASGDYGLQVVNAGATVIIDGSSNMFKIAASGTLSSISGPNGTFMDLTVTLATGLSSPPMHTGSAGFVFGLIPYAVFSINAPAGRLDLVDMIQQHTEVVNTNQTRVTARWSSGVNRSAQGWSVKYFVYKEAAV